MHNCKQRHQHAGYEGAGCFPLDEGAKEGLNCGTYQSHSDGEVYLRKNRTECKSLRQIQVHRARSCSSKEIPPCSQNKNQPAKAPRHRIEPQRVPHSRSGFHYAARNVSRDDQKQQTRQQPRSMKRQRYGDTSDTSDQSEDVPQRQKELAWLGIRGEQITHQQMTVSDMSHPGEVGECVVISRQKSAEQ